MATQEVAQTVHQPFYCGPDSMVAPHLPVGSPKALLATIESQAARIEALEEVVAHRGMALAPFAEACSNCIDETDRDEDCVWEHPIGMELTFRDFREAHQVLTTLAKLKGE